MQKLFVYGTGALARQLCLYNERYPLYDIIAYVDDNIIKNKFMDRPVISFDALPPPPAVDVKIMRIR